jgi:hypothetical protein
MKNRDPENWELFPFIRNSVPFRSVSQSQSGGFLRLSRFGTPHAINPASAQTRQAIQMKGLKMTAQNSFAAKFTAAFSALALSLVLFANTTAVPQAQAATAYVGMVA